MARDIKKYPFINDMKRMMKIRKEFVKKINEYDGEYLLKVDSAVLDMLLFDEFNILDNNGNVISFKIPILSGDFLSKIDLSEVSFDNVYWSFLYMGFNLDKYFEKIKNDCRFAKVDSDKLKARINSYFNKIAGQLDDDVLKLRKTFLLSPDKSFDYYVDYSNTNANISFDNSFDMPYNDELSRSFLELISPSVLELNILGCNFSGNEIRLLDNYCRELSKFHFEYCCLMNCNIKDFNDTDWGKRIKTFSASNCNFEGTNLEKLNYLLNLSILDEMACRFEDSNLRNTKLKIYVDSSSYIVYINRTNSENTIKKNISYNWVGCYLNDHLIKSSEDLDKIKERAKNMDNDVNEFLSELTTSLSDEAQGDVFDRKKRTLRKGDVS